MISVHKSTLNYSLLSVFVFCSCKTTQENIKDSILDMVRRAGGII